ncbi:MAG TPA: hypothetical protein VKY73_09110 [Polyangiaceae bacterium]|nr:hypothetical protein [Polyangiaceae bacterium]
MRAPVRLLAVFVAVAGSLGLVSGCVPDKHKEADFLKAPKSWDPKEDSLTFGTKNLEAFNSMSEDEREAHVEALKGKPGSFKGQARFERGSELSENIDDAKFGKFEATAQVTDPILYEITIEYQLFANEKIGHGFPAGTYIEFSGTLADLEYRQDAKPRKLVIKVKDVTVERLGS